MKVKVKNKEQLSKYIQICKIQQNKLKKKNKNINKIIQFLINLMGLN
jgi:hypothetical protein